MCSIQDAFPDLNFSNNVPAVEQKVLKAKNELLQMQEERGKMMSFQCSDVTTPYFIQNQPNIPHIAKTTLAGDFSIAGSGCNCPPGKCSCNNCNCAPGKCTCGMNAATERYADTASAFTPEIITDQSLLVAATSEDTSQKQSDTMLQQLAAMVHQLDTKVNGLERKCNSRNSHDMLLFIVIVIFVILVIDTLMKN